MTVVKITRISLLVLTKIYYNSDDIQIDFSNKWMQNTHFHGYNTCAYVNPPDVIFMLPHGLLQVTDLSHLYAGF